MDVVVIVISVFCVSCWHTSWELGTDKTYRNLLDLFMSCISIISIICVCFRDVTVIEFSKYWRHLFALEISNWYVTALTSKFICS